MTDASKITASHRSRRCVVYVRQSTLAQTRANTESLERQYELDGRAVALGWGPGLVQVVDADLGLSGAQAASREGFQELWPRSRWAGSGSSSAWRRAGSPGATPTGISYWTCAG